MLLDYATVRAAQDSLKTTRAEMENTLKKAIGEREGIFSPSGRFTWRLTKDKAETDWQSLAITLLTNHVKDETARAALMESHTHSKPGTRRIWFNYDDVKLQAA